MTLKEKFKTAVEYSITAMIGAAKGGLALPIALQALVSRSDSPAAYETRQRRMQDYGGIACFSAIASAASNSHFNTPLVSLYFGLGAACGAAYHLERKYYGSPPAPR